jgi:purine-binding chemotaxis protein CheW
VLALTPEQISPAPTFGSAMKTEYLTGLGTVAGRMMILADIEKLVDSDELALIDRVAA